MTHLFRLALALACCAGLLAQAGSAQASCACHKEQLIKEFGTLSLLHPLPPLPPPLPPAKAGAPTSS